MLHISNPNTPFDKTNCPLAVCFVFLFEKRYTIFMFKNLYTNNLNLCIFDIETTGLSPEKDIVISASFCDEDGLSLVQYFCDSPESEFLLIGKIIEDISKYDAIITYNGRNFDIPFIMKRAKKYGLNTDALNIKNIDIYRYLKQYWKAAGLLSSLSQSSVEKALGLDEERTDEINGAECIPLYNHYLISGSELDKEKILLHNADDVRQLSRIANKLSFLPFHQIAYDDGYIIKKRENYPGATDYTIEVLDYVYKPDKLICHGRTIPGLTPIDVYDEYYKLIYDSYSGAILLEINTFEIEHYSYIDLNKLPVLIDDYINLDGFSNNYLIFKHSTEFYYKEINLIVIDLLRRI